MKRLFVAMCVALPLAGCAGTYGYGGGVYAGGPYAYDGFYDGYYGPIYDGYWGTDGAFYFRGGGGDRHFRRGDPGHFHRGGPPPSSRFQPMRGQTTPSPGVRMPRFPGGQHGGRPGRH